MLNSEPAFYIRKGGDPAAGSPTATLLRLHPNYQPYRGRLPPGTQLQMQTLPSNDCTCN